MDLTQFTFEGSQLRTIIEEDKTYFVATDVCQILGYAKSASQVIKTHCKSDGVLKRYTTDSVGRGQELVCITEGNLYRLITKSKMPNSDKFENWVFDVVLPTIRKTGKYEVEQKPSSPAELLLQNAQILVAHEQRFTHLENEVKELKAYQTTHPQDHFTIAGYGTIKGVRVDIKLAAILGRKATSVCNQLGFITGKIPDPRFGTVKTYPKDVLENVFSEYANQNAPVQLSHLRLERE